MGLTDVGVHVMFALPEVAVDSGTALAIAAAVEGGRDAGAGIGVGAGGLASTYKETPKTVTTRQRAKPPT
jgi:hypothetical protein